MRRDAAKWLIAVVFLPAIACCNKDDESVNVANYLFVTPNSVTIQSGRDTTISIRGGVPPYYIKQKPSPAVATATLVGSMVTLHANSPSDDRMVIGDDAPRQNLAVVSITVTPDSSSLR